MTANIFILDPGKKDWHLEKTMKDVTPDEFAEIEAYKDYHEGQVKVEYTK